MPQIADCLFFLLLTTTKNKDLFTFPKYNVNNANKGFIPFWQVYYNKLAF